MRRNVASSSSPRARRSARRSTACARSGRRRPRFVPTTTGRRRARRSGTRASMSALISSIVVGIEPAAQVQEPGFGEEVRDVVVVVVGGEGAVQVERRAVAVVGTSIGAARVHRPGVDRASAAPPTSRGSRRGRRAACRAVPPVRNVIGVLRSLTTSATSSSVSRTTAAASTLAIDGERVAGERERPLARGCDDGERFDPSSRAPRAAKLAIRRDHRGQLLVEELPRVDCCDVVVRAGPEVQRDHRQVVARLRRTRP